MQTNTAPAGLPEYMDRRAAADALTRHLFPVSPRTLEVWPLATRRVNGKALISTAEVFTLARAKLNAAPAIMGGRKAA